MQVKRNAHKVLVKTPEGKRALGRLKCRWKDNIKMDVTAKGCSGTNQIHLTQD
jgi:hypothetical protein